MTTSKLYDEVVLDHIRHARNYRVIEHPDRRAEAVNPLCGDQFTIYATLDGDVITDLAFQCECCGISMASASIMTVADRVAFLYQGRVHALATPAELAASSDPIVRQFIGGDSHGPMETPGF